MKTNLILLAICLVVGILLGTLALAQVVPCRTSYNMPTPCSGLTYYNCWDGCTYVDQGAAKSDCTIVFSGACCQWREEPHTCTGGSCNNCGTLTLAVEYVQGQYNYECRTFGSGGDKVCFPAD